MSCLAESCVARVPVKAAPCASPLSPGPLPRHDIVQKPVPRDCGEPCAFIPREFGDQPLCTGCPPVPIRRIFLWCYHVRFEDLPYFDVQGSLHPCRRCGDFMRAELAYRRWGDKKRSSEGPQLVLCLRPIMRSSIFVHSASNAPLRPHIHLGQAAHPDAFPGTDVPLKLLVELVVLAQTISMRVRDPLRKELDLRFVPAQYRHEEGLPLLQGRP